MMAADKDAGEGRDGSNSGESNQPLPRDERALPLPFLLRYFCESSENTPHGRWGQGPDSVDPRFPAGLPFPVPQILEFVAFGDSGKFSSNFPGIFPGLPSRTPARTPETATAFSSFLKSVPSYWQFVSRYGSHLHCDAFAEVLGSGSLGHSRHELPRQRFGGQANVVTGKFKLGGVHRGAYLPQGQTGQVATATFWGGGGGQGGNDLSGHLES